MNTIFFDHRSNCEHVPARCYRKFADALIVEAQLIPELASVILCGSYTKGTLVPGWSDLDVVFLTKETATARTLRSIGAAIRKTRQIWPIAVGADVISLEQFRGTRRFGGRPIAMTFEVAASGHTAFGEDVLSEIEWQPGYAPVVAADVQRLIPAELHNWRRWFMESDLPSRSEAALRRSLKTCLKIAKYESDPNLKPPFSYEQCVESLHAAGHSGPVDIWALAAETRTHWQEVLSDPSEVEMRSRVFADTLACYKL